jgi:hypothetical protein
VTLSDEPIAGQLDVYECLEIAEQDGHGSAEKPAVPAQAPRPLSAAEVVKRMVGKQ